MSGVVDGSMGKQSLELDAELRERFEAASLPVDDAYGNRGSQAIASKHLEGVDDRAAAGDDIFTLFQ